MTEDNKLNIKLSKDVINYKDIVNVVQTANMDENYAKLIDNLFCSIKEIVPIIITITRLNNTLIDFFIFSSFYNFILSHILYKRQVFTIVLIYFQLYFKHKK